MNADSNRAGVRRVLWITLLLNLLVSGGKIVIGTLTGALSITADGFHSLMDGSSNLLGLIANRIAGKPADADHPYGHRRFETLAALAVGVLLLVTAFEIVTGAIERIQNPQTPEITPMTFGVMLLTLGINLFVSRYERSEGERLRSELLIADAANTSADVFVTLSVLISMVLVSFGWTWADPAAALIIVVLIGRAAWQVLSQTGQVLVDAAPYDPAMLAELAARAPGIDQVIRTRSRGTPDAAHIDIDVQVHPAMTAEQTAAITDTIRETMRANLEGIAEVEVHFAPQERASHDYTLMARACADALGLLAHEVRVSDTPQGKILEMHVEVPPGQTLGEAHAQVTRLEHDVHAALPELAEVTTHIEPRAAPARVESTQSAQDLADRATELLKRMYPHGGWHHARAEGSVDAGYTLSLHVALDPLTPVEEAHKLAEDAETFLKSNYPRITRVTIHTEPPEESR